MTSTSYSRSYLNDKKLNKIEQNKALKDGLDIGKEINKFAEIGWENIDKVDRELRLKWYGLFWRPKTPGKFMLRLRVPNGILNTKQIQAIASIVNRYGDDGSCDITTRQNIQVRGILISDFPDILKRLKECNLYTTQSGFDNPRNVTGNALAGIDPHEIIDTRKYTNILNNFLTDGNQGNKEFSNLPRKWNTAVAGSKDNFLLHNDIVFHPIKREGLLGFGVWIGGILSSQMNEYAIPLNAWIHEKDICKITSIIISIWRDQGERDKRPKGRFRFFLNQIGIENFRKMVEDRYGELLADPGSEFNIKPRSIFGIHSQKQENLNYAGLHIPVGKLSGEDLLDIATISSTYGNSEIRLTEDQNLIISGIKNEKIKEFKTNILLNKFSLNPTPLTSGTVACTGNTYCSFALTNTKDQAHKIAKELDSEIVLPNEVKIHWTGCPNSCGQAYMGAIGLTGTKSKNKNGKMVEAYDISVGGKQGPYKKLGKLIHKGIPTEELKPFLKKLLIEDFSAKPKIFKSSKGKIFSKLFFNLRDFLKGSYET